MTNIEQPITARLRDIGNEPNLPMWAKVVCIEAASHIDLLQRQVNGLLKTITADGEQNAIDLAREIALCDLLADRLRTVMGWVEFEDGDAALYDYDEARNV